MKKKDSVYETVSVDPSHDTQAAKEANDRALELMAKGKYPKAEAKLREALAADVTYGPAHNNLGELYYSQGKMYLAAWEFEYATKLMRERPEPHNNLGLVLEAVGKPDEAIEAYQIAYDIQPKNPQIVGNLARARYRCDPKDPSVRTLLQELLCVETRPSWLRWAQEVLVLGDLPCEQSMPYNLPPKQKNSLEIIPTPSPIPFGTEITVPIPFGTEITVPIPFGTEITVPMPILKPASQAIPVFQGPEVISDFNSENFYSHDQIK